MNLSFFEPAFAADMLIMKPWITTKMSRLRVAGWNIERPVSPSELRRVQGPQAKNEVRRGRVSTVSLSIC